MDDILLTELRGHEAILTLIRPDKYNALSHELLRAIGDKMLAIQIGLGGGVLRFQGADDLKPHAHCVHRHS